MQKDEIVEDEFAALDKAVDDHFAKQLNLPPPKYFKAPHEGLNRKERRTYVALKQREATKKRLGIKPRGKP